MTEVQRTLLDWARDACRAYRWALMKVDPVTCVKLDAEARAAGQNWIAPRLIPTKAAEELAAATMTPAEIAKESGIPAGTIYSWISRGLLKPANGDAQPAKYLVADVVNIQARRKARRLDSA